MTPWPLWTRLEIEWRDSHSRGGWDSVKNHRAQRGVGPQRSIGYLLTKDKDVIQLAQSMATSGNVTDTITIPRENVTRITRLSGGIRKR